MIARRTLLAAGALSPLAACATAPTARPGPELKLATFNIWHNQGDWAARRPLLIAALVGLVSLELAGHLVGTADPADRLFEALVARQVATLRLD